MMLTKKALTISLATAAMGLAMGMLCTAATAADWPTRPIRLVNPYAPGAAGDLITRELAAGMQAEFGVPVITENKPGGGTVIGANFVAKSPPDGYNILMIGPATHVIMPAIHPNLPYNPTRDFDIIGMWAIIGSMISVNPSVPVTSLKELIDYSKANPGKLNFASAGNGSGPHLAGETFKQMTKSDLTHVPYVGASPAVTALVGGEVQVSFVNIPPQVAFVKAGKIRPLAVMSETRSTALPDVPTTAEAGLPGLISESWYGVAVPAGTPADVREKLRQAMMKAGSDKERIARVNAAGIEIRLMDAQQATAYIKSEEARVKPVLKSIDLKIE